MSTHPTDQEILAGIKQGWGVLKIKAEIGGGQKRIQQLRDEYKRCQTTPNTSNIIPCSTSTHQPSTMSPTTLTKSQVGCEDTPSEDSTQVLSLTTPISTTGTPTGENGRYLPPTNAFIPNADAIRHAFFALTGKCFRDPGGEAVVLRAIMRAASDLLLDFAG